MSFHPTKLSSHPTNGFPFHSDSSGYYEFTGRDGDGWPHFKALKAPPEAGVLQELLLKECVIKYFGQ